MMRRLGVLTTAACLGAAGMLIHTRGMAEDEEAGEGGSRSSRPVMARMLKLSFDEEEIRLWSGGILWDSPDGEKFQNLKDGEVFGFISARATKLKLTCDLRFGDTVVRSGNLHPTYAGVYSLWMRKRGGEWFLVFNEEGDIWGTMRDPEKDVTEVKLTHTESERKSASLRWELRRKGEGAVIRIKWGHHEWETEFEPVAGAKAVAE